MPQIRLKILMETSEWLWRKADENECATPSAYLNLLARNDRPGGFSDRLAEIEKRMAALEARLASAPAKIEPVRPAAPPADLAHDAVVDVTDDDLAPSVSLIAPAPVAPVVPPAAASGRCRVTRADQAKLLALIPEEGVSLTEWHRLAKAGPMPRLSLTTLQRQASRMLMLKPPPLAKMLLGQFTVYRKADA